MGFAILSIGTASPEFKIQQSDAAELAQSFTGNDGPRSLQVLQKLYERTGVHTRHSVLLKSSSNGAPANQDFYPVGSPGELGPSTADRMLAYQSYAGKLACQAATEALHLAKVPADQISHLITVSCSGFAAPGVDIELITELGLSADVARTHVGFMGCHGSLNGLRMARAIAESDPSANVLLCAVELCSLHYQYGSERDQMVANALFSDGAAAVVGTSSTGPYESTTNMELTANGSSIIPDTRDMMGWRIDDHGFCMTLSPQVPAIINEQLAPWMDAWLKSHSLTRADIQGWCVHPGGPRILQATEDSLELSSDALAPSRQILSQFGNMSSPTILFVLQNMLAQATKTPIVMLGFGPGLAIEAALIK
ncbi:MAG: type III polyketide synthase [Planctomycetota bacterium]